MTSRATGPTQAKRPARRWALTMAPQLSANSRTGGSWTEGSRAKVIGCSHELSRKLQRADALIAGEACLQGGLRDGRTPVKGDEDEDDENRSEADSKGDAVCRDGHVAGGASDWSHLAGGGGTDWSHGVGVGGSDWRHVVRGDKDHVVVGGAEGQVATCTGSDSSRLETKADSSLRRGASMIIWPRCRGLVADNRSLLHVHIFSFDH
ncbi:hypothetical protein V8E36_008117, partial [Tilletia maclaganii]